jgi:hypothetical protein
MGGGELRADLGHLLEESEVQIAAQIALAELQGERCRIGRGAAFELGQRRTLDVELERLSFDLACGGQLQVGVRAAGNASEAGGEGPPAAQIVVAN